MKILENIDFQIFIENNELDCENFFNNNNSNQASKDHIKCEQGKTELQNNILNTINNTSFPNAEKKRTFEPSTQVLKKVSDSVILRTNTNSDANNLANNNIKEEKNTSEKKEKLTYKNLLSKKIEIFTKKNSLNLKILRDNDILKSLIYISNRKLSNRYLPGDDSLNKALITFKEHLEKLPVNKIEVEINKKYKDEIESDLNCYLNLPQDLSQQKSDFAKLENYLENKSLEEAYNIFSLNSAFKNSLKIKKNFLQKNFNIVDDKYIKAFQDANNFIENHHYANNENEGKCSNNPLSQKIEEIDIHAIKDQCHPLVENFTNKKSGNIDSDNKEKLIEEIYNYVISQKSLLSVNNNNNSDLNNPISMKFINEKIHTILSSSDSQYAGLVEDNRLMNQNKNKDNNNEIMNNKNAEIFKTKDHIEPEFNLSINNKNGDKDIDYSYSNNGESIYQELLSAISSGVSAKLEREEKIKLFLNNQENLSSFLKSFNPRSSFKNISSTNDSLSTYNSTNTINSLLDLTKIIYCMESLINKNNKNNKSFPILSKNFSFDNLANNKHKIFEFFKDAKDFIDESRVLNSKSNSKLQNSKMRNSNLYKNKKPKKQKINKQEILIPSNNDTNINNNNSFTCSNVENAENNGNASKLVSEKNKNAKKKKVYRAGDLKLIDKTKPEELPQAEASFTNYEESNEAGFNINLVNLISNSDSNNTQFMAQNNHSREKNKQHRSTSNIYAKKSKKTTYANKNCESNLFGASNTLVESENITNCNSNNPSFINTLNPVVSKNEEKASSSNITNRNNTLRYDYPKQNNSFKILLNNIDSTKLENEKDGKYPQADNIHSKGNCNTFIMNNNPLNKSKQSFIISKNGVIIENKNRLANYNLSSSTNLTNQVKNNSLSNYVSNTSNSNCSHASNAINTNTNTKNIFDIKSEKGPKLREKNTNATINLFSSENPATQSQEKALSCHSSYVPIANDSNYYNQDTTILANNNLNSCPQNSNSIEHSGIYNKHLSSLEDKIYKKTYQHSLKAEKADKLKERLGTAKNKIQKLKQYVPEQRQSKSLSSKNIFDKLQNSEISPGNRQENNISNNIYSSLNSCSDFSPNIKFSIQKNNKNKTNNLATNTEENKNSNLVNMSSNELCQFIESKKIIKINTEKLSEYINNESKVENLSGFDSYIAKTYKPRRKLNSKEKKVKFNNKHDAKQVLSIDHLNPQYSKENNKNINTSIVNVNDFYINNNNNTNNNYSKFNNINNNGNKTPISKEISPNKNKLKGNSNTTLIFQTNKTENARRLLKREASDQKVCLNNSHNAPANSDNIIINTANSINKNSDVNNNKIEKLNLDMNIINPPYNCYSLTNTHETRQTQSLVNSYSTTMNSYNLENSKLSNTTTLNNDDTSKFNNLLVKKSEYFGIVEKMQDLISAKNMTNSSSNDPSIQNTHNSHYSGNTLTSILTNAGNNNIFNRLIKATGSINNHNHNNNNSTASINTNSFFNSLSRKNLANSIYNNFPGNNMGITNNTIKASPHQMTGMSLQKPFSSLETERDREKETNKNVNLNNNFISNILSLNKNNNTSNSNTSINTSHNAGSILSNNLNNKNNNDFSTNASSNHIANSCHQGHATKALQEASIILNKTSQEKAQLNNMNSINFPNNFEILNTTTPNNNIINNNRKTTPSINLIEKNNDNSIKNINNTASYISSSEQKISGINNNNNKFISAENPTNATNYNNTTGNFIKITKDINNINNNTSSSNNSNKIRKEDSDHSLIDEESNNKKMNLNVNFNLNLKVNLKVKSRSEKRRLNAEKEKLLKEKILNHLSYPQASSDLANNKISTSNSPKNQNQISKKTNNHNINNSNINNNITNYINNNNVTNNYIITPNTSANKLVTGNLNLLTSSEACTMVNKCSISNPSDNLISNGICNSNRKNEDAFSILNKSTSANSKPQQQQPENLSKAFSNNLMLGFKRLKPESSEASFNNPNAAFSINNSNNNINKNSISNNNNISNNVSSNLSISEHYLSNDSMHLGNANSEKNIFLKNLNASTKQDNSNSNNNSVKFPNISNTLYKNLSYFPQVENSNVDSFYNNNNNTGNGNIYNNKPINNRNNNNVNKLNSAIFNLSSSEPSGVSDIINHKLYAHMNLNHNKNNTKNDGNKNNEFKKAFINTLNKVNNSKSNMIDSIERPNLSAIEYKKIPESSFIEAPYSGVKGNFYESLLGDNFTSNSFKPSQQYIEYNKVNAKKIKFGSRDKSPDKETKLRNGTETDSCSSSPSSSSLALFSLAQDTLKITDNRFGFNKLTSNIPGIVYTQLNFNKITNNIKHKSLLFIITI